MEWSNNVIILLSLFSSSNTQFIVDNLIMKNIFKLENLINYCP